MPIRFVTVYVYEPGADERPGGPFPRLDVSSGLVFVEVDGARHYLGGETEPAATAAVRRWNAELDALDAAKAEAARRARAAEEALASESVEAKPAPSESLDVDALATSIFPSDATPTPTMAIVREVGGKVLGGIVAGDKVVARHLPRLVDLLSSDAKVEVETADGADAATLAASLSVDSIAPGAHVYIGRVSATDLRIGRVPVAVFLRTGLATFDPLYEVN